MTPSQTILFPAPSEAASPARARQRKLERDRSLEALQQGRRRALIELAHRVAVEMAEANACAMPEHGIPDHCITASQVKDEMVRRGYLSKDDKNTRWLGGFVPGGKGASAKWRNVGQTTATASKGRPSSVWALIKRVGA